MHTMTLCLPLPVSLNKAYANKTKKGGRVKTVEAKDWYARARHFAAPFIKDYRAICDHNVLARRNYMTSRCQLGGRPGMRLAALKADYPDVAYAVTYTFHFPDDGIRDVFNFEKLLTDLLVECGFLLDDNFIVDGRVKWGKLAPNNPHVAIEIISLDRATVL